MGIFRQVSRPTYDDQLREQIHQAKASDGEADLAALLAGRDIWTVD